MKNIHAFDLDINATVSPELDLFAEELSEDALANVAGGNCFGCAGTFGTGGATLGSMGTYGCLTDKQ